MTKPISLDIVFQNCDNNNNCSIKSIGFFFEALHKHPVLNNTPFLTLVTGPSQLTYSEKC